MDSGFGEVRTIALPIVYLTMSVKISVSLVACVAFLPGCHGAATWRLADLAFQ